MQCGVVGCDVDVITSRTPVAQGLRISVSLMIVFHVSCLTCLSDLSIDFIDTHNTLWSTMNIWDSMNDHTTTISDRVAVSRRQSLPHDQNGLYWVRLSARSRIGILADKVICNHDLRYNTCRLYWSSDCTKRRSSFFGKACNSKASTQGDVEQVLGKASNNSSIHFFCKEHWAGTQDDSEFSTEVRTCLGEMGQIASDVETDVVLKKEDITERMLDFGQFDFGQFDFGQLGEIELAEVEIGRSRNWPKSKLAELEIGRSRN